MDSVATQPAFVLVNPQMGENIGAAARAMLNFGLTSMRLVAPRDGWPNPRAAALAAGAGRILDAAPVFATAAEAVADCHAVFATTARRRDLAQPVLSPEAAMAQARARAASGQRVAILLGPERAGLESADVALADAIVTVPVNPDFASLNLAQCALLLAYEWSQAQREAGADAETAVAGRGDPPATHREVEELARHYQDELEAAGFFFPRAKADSMKRNLRSLWARMPLTGGDVRIFHGILRQLARARRDGG